jgi:DNA-binding FrmR family transcriptional regulator
MPTIEKEDRLASLHRRLSIAEGQVHGLREMLGDEERTPREVVTLLRGIRAQLDSVAALLAHHYLDQCLDGNPDAEDEEGWTRRRALAIRRILGGPG